jgi:hypothetical protein
MSMAPNSIEPSDEGFAMIISMVVATVAILLVTVVLAMGVHLNGSTVRDRSLQLALQVAETGVDQVAADLDQAIRTGTTYTGTATPVDVPGGTYQAKVTTVAKGYQIDSIGTVQGVKRRIRVQYLPEPIFTYALFSNSGLFVKSTGGVEGDIYGNLDVEIYNGTEVTGDVVSATGKVYLQQNAKVLKDGDDGGSVTSGGYDSAATPRWAVRLDNNAVVERDVKTQVASSGSPCPDGSSYNVTNNGAINGRVLTPGSVTGTLPAGGVSYDCTARAGSGTSFPVYTPGQNGTVSKTLSEFAAMSSLSGKIEVVATETDSIDLACKTITGDFILVTKAVIRKSNTCGSIPTFSGSPDSIVQIISQNSLKQSQADPAVDFENKFELPSPAPAVLLYSPGFCDLKNSVLTSGAVYCNGINIKNDLTITYDDRVERVLGFGTTLYVKSGFRELPSSTPL